MKIQVTPEHVEKVRKHLANGAQFEIAPTPSDGTFALNLVPRIGPSHRLALSHSRTELKAYMLTLKTEAMHMTPAASGLDERNRMSRRGVTAPKKYTLTADVTLGKVKWWQHIFWVKYTRGWFVTLVVIDQETEAVKRFNSMPESHAPNPADVASATAELIEASLVEMKDI